MKKFILFMLLFAAFTGQELRAGEDEKISVIARQAFEKEFPGAQYVKWERVDRTDAYLVRFVYNNQGLVSYIKDDGMMLATVRRIEKESLPFRVSETLARRFGGYKITGIEELTMSSDLSYIVVLENEKAIVSIRVYSSGSFTELAREKKKPAVTGDKR